MPEFAERGFRWIKETVALIYAHHKHPIPMVALIFMYAETLGKPLAVATGKTPDTKNKVCAFTEAYLPKLWAALSAHSNRADILGNHYRNGLAHELFMKQNAGIHEGGSDYITNAPGIPYSINIDLLVPEFLEGLAAYYARLGSDAAFVKIFNEQLGDEEIVQKP